MSGAGERTAGGASERGVGGESERGVGGAREGVDERRGRERERRRSDAGARRMGGVVERG